MPEPLKFCKDCAHCALVDAFIPNEFKHELEGRDLPKNHICMRPWVNVVTGESSPFKTSCIKERSGESPTWCGHEGLFFVSK